MADMSLTKNPMPEQDPLVRAGNFDEVALGYTKELAVAEAKRCLNCPNPLCRTGCPVSVRIPEFIAKVVEEDFDAAYDILTSTNSLPAVCGRVCPQEKQCESKCVRGKKGESVAIGRLERFVADYHNAKKEKAPVEVPASNGHRVAVIGSGPSGLTCAGDLRKMGYDVTIFEAFHKSGGVLVYGIPQFRLPKEIVQVEIDNLVAMGVKIVNNAVIGKSETVDELFEDGFEAVYIGSGAGLPQFLHIPGENLLGVYSANEILTRTNLMKAYRDDYDTPLKHFHNVAVVGGGNVAMDAARVAKRLGDGHVYITYRRGMDELPARKEEVEHAVAEGIEFQLLNNPVSVVGDENGRVTGIELIRQELGEPDEKGHRKPVGTGKFEILEVDSVIGAIGQRIDWGKLDVGTLKTTKKGTAEADGLTYQTAEPDIFVGGDVYTGPSFAINAIAAGKEAAISLHRWVHPGQTLTMGRDRRVYTALDKEHVQIEVGSFDTTHRQVHGYNKEKAKTFADARVTFTEEQVRKETARCLGCGATKVDPYLCIGCGICTTRCKFDAIHLKKVRDWHAGSFETMPIKAAAGLVKKTGNIVKRTVSK